MSQSFRAAVEQCTPLRSHLRDGLKALRRRDRLRVRCVEPRRIVGSVDLDAAMRTTLPNAPRWDYGVGHASDAAGDCAHWIEVHPASAREVDVVERKLIWLKQWLGDNVRALRGLPRRFVWVASGRTSLSPTSPDRKRLAQLGLVHVGRVYELR